MKSKPQAEPRFSVDSISGGEFRVTTRGDAPRDGTLFTYRGTVEFTLVACIGVHADGSRSWTATIRKLKRQT